MSKVALVTGISGFAGSFLAEELLRQGYTVHGTHVSDDTKNLSEIKKDVELHKVDLSDFEQTKKCIEKASPDYIFHLAALTSPAESFKEPAKVMNANITAQMNVFEGVRSANIDPKILVTSSAEVYGMVEPQDLPVNENAPLRPGSPYAVSKIAQDFLGLQYFLSYGMKILRVRPFNHVGPRQTPQFVIPAFASQIAEIEKGAQKPVLTVGNLDARRDFTDVRDMVKAYVLVIEKGEIGEVYNIGSGKSRRIGEILDQLLVLSTVSIEVELDPGKLRPSDIPNIYSDNSKIEAATGWKTEIDFEKTLKDTLDYFRDNV